MSIRKTIAVAACVLCAGPALAVDFGVMETADVIEPGDFKFIAFPLAVNNGPRREQDSGVTVGLGYGLSRRVDVELQVGTYDDFTFYGGDLEYTYRPGRPLELSVGGGAHYARTDFGDPWGLDFTHIASYTLERFPSWRLNGGLDFGYEVTDAQFAAAIGADDQRHWTAYAVPGVQFRASDNVDIVGEVGVGLNGESDDYLAAGVSYYFGRRDDSYAAPSAARGPNSSASRRSPSSSTK